VLLLSAAAPSLGAPAASDGWRARGSSANAAPTRRVAARPAVRQVAWHDDLAGPALRIAQRDAPDGLGDSLRESFERPFGVDSGDTRPAGPEGFDAPAQSDADRADRLFDDLPEEPADEPAPVFEDEFDDQQMAPGDGLFDDEPQTDFGPAEPIAPGEPAGDDFGQRLSEPDLEPVDPRGEERDRAYQDCSGALAELKGSRLDAIDLSIRLEGDEGQDYPYNCTLDDGTMFTPRSWGEITYTWKASGLCHKPLYFQDVSLERYGHSWGPYVQPLVSGAHFFGRLTVLPYMMGLQTPDECVYTLGHYRPGDCAPYLIDPVPFTWRAALFQTGGVFGVAGVLP